MEITVDGALRYIIKESHPDADKVDNINEIKNYSDRFRINTEMFFGTDDWLSYIKKELALVASGGYSTKHIQILDYEINTNKLAY